MTEAARSALAAATPPGERRPGNPSLHLIPRCGARTRAGCPCRAPAIHGKRRCRMHGGRSTGPRTPQARQRLREARLLQGAKGAAWRAQDFYCDSSARSGRVFCAAIRYRDWLAPRFAARLSQHAPELDALPRPAGGLTVAQDRALRRAHQAVLAPWRAAIAAARDAARAHRRTRPQAVAATPASRAPLPTAQRISDLEVHAPIPRPGADGISVSKAHAPIPPSRAGGISALEPHAPMPAPDPREIFVAEPHAPIPPPAKPPGMNRAARRRWESQQRRERNHPSTANPGLGKGLRQRPHAPATL